MVACYRKVTVGVEPGLSITCTHISGAVDNDIETDRGDDLPVRLLLLLLLLLLFVVVVVEGRTGRAVVGGGVP